jgi:hypothetical protein
MMQSHWESKVAQMPQVAGAAVREMPRYYNTPLFLNPFYAVASALKRGHQKFPDWLICALFYLTLGVLSAFLAFRNIRRRGESG